MKNDKDDFADFIAALCIAGIIIVILIAILTSSAQSEPSPFGRSIFSAHAACSALP